MSKYFKADLFEDCLDKPLPDNILASIVEDFKKGIFTRRKQFIECFCKTAIGIAVNLCGTDDGVAEALAALCEVPDDILKGKMYNDNIKQFVKCRIHTRCTRHRRYSKMLVKIPHTSKHIKLEGTNAVSVSYDNSVPGMSTREYQIGEKILADSKVVPPDQDIISKETWKAVVTDYRESKIIELFLQNYNNREIAKILQVSPSHVGLLLFRIALRLKELKDNEKT